MTQRTLIRSLCAAMVLTLGILVTQTAGAATILIINIDGAGEGFNDPTPVAPVGGNPGVTLGQQRLNAFTYAANLWGACLQSSITIEVEAKMDPQFCSPTSAVLGSAGATYVHRDFPGAPLAATWYSQALANALAGVDLNPGTPEISATFNSNLNGSASCLGGIGWYYGYDELPGGDIDFITVVFHEIGHGLGFQTFQSSAGAWFLGFKDTYGTLMYHVGTVPPDYPSMTQAQRGACNIGDPNLVWDGSAANLLGGSVLVSGINSGRVRLHGPNPYQSGSSLSHWSTGLSPNQLMEPAYTGPNHSGALDLQLLHDTGWVLIPKACDPITLLCDSLQEVSCTNGEWTFQLQVTNTGTEDALAVMGNIISSPYGVIDGTCDYDDISAGVSDFGLDDYTIDMSSWDGQPFDITFELTYDDGCGGSFADTLTKQLDRPRPQIVCPQTPAKEVAFAYPNWDIMLRIDNLGDLDAVNVQGELSDLPVWMTPSADLTSAYGTIAPSDTSCGNDPYRLKVLDWPGGSFPLSLIVTYDDSCGISYSDTLQKTVSPPTPTGVPGRPVVDYHLSQNVPNPFNPTTVIRYELPAREHVRLRVYDVSGRLVRSLVDEFKDEGRYQALWDGRDTGGRSVASGIYFYRLQAGSFTETKRMVLLK